tara:strand:+ start:307 stop:840 length:534 start_codon:yes stop_codon:yes gene_type:complete
MSAGLNIQALSEEHVRNLASQPGVTVMQPTHDVEFSAWAPAKVRKCVTQLEALTKADPSTCKAKALADDTLAQFAKTYQVFFERMTTASFVAIASNVATIHKMIQIKTDMDDCVITSDEGNRRAAEAALANVTDAVEKARAKQGSEQGHDDRHEFPSPSHDKPQVGQNGTDTITSGL